MCSRHINTQTHAPLRTGCNVFIIPLCFEFKMSSLVQHTLFHSILPSAITPLLCSADLYLSCTWMSRWDICWSKCWNSSGLFDFVREKWLCRSWLYRTFLCQFLWQRKWAGVGFVSQKNVKKLPFPELSVTGWLHTHGSNFIFPQLMWHHRGTQRGRYYLTPCVSLNCITTPYLSHVHLLNIWFT